MFTGIIEKSSSIRSVEKVGKGMRITVAKPRGWRVERGASVALDGICLTATGAPSEDLSFDLMGETLSKTTAKYFTKGRLVNLERPLTLGAEVGGHFVQGHIDARASVVGVEKKGWSQNMTIEIPSAFRRLVAEVGSIAVNGVSLTVSRKKGTMVTVSLIPHTLRTTNLGALKKGDEVNVEFDLLARYLAARGER